MKNQAVIAQFAGIVNEKDGQQIFFTKILGDDYADYVRYPCRCDGVYGSTIFEFKLAVDNNAPLFQTIKYLSRIRNSGEVLPDKIAIVSLLDTKVYLYQAKNFIRDIEKQYINNPSAKTYGFISNVEPDIYDFSEKGVINKLQTIFETVGFTPTSVDSHNVVGLSRRYYKESKFRNKVKFFEALRQGTIGEDIAPWVGDNIDFRYIMDILNDPHLQKELGAFYTPKPYVQLATDLVREAIAQVPEGNDYIILDRCAGTGNLQELLTEEELSHCVLNTIEIKEYLVLRAEYEGRVREILTYTEDLSSPLIAESDALAYRVLPGVEKYVNDPKCNVIIFENPPYSESGAQTEAEGGNNKENLFKLSLICAEMKKALPGKGKLTNEIANLFIWSAQQYYLTKPNDAYINFSPAKYFKTQELVDITFVKGYGLNRKHFHATASTITLSYWLNQKAEQENFAFDFYDIDKNNQLVFVKTQICEKCYILNSTQYDKRRFELDVIDDNFICQTDGSLYYGKQKKSIVPLYNSNILGYLATQSFVVDAKTSSLLRFGRYDGHGFYLREDNFLEKLVFFANSIPTSTWYERDFIYKTADGYEEAIQDKQFLKEVLFFTAMSFWNKSRSLTINEKVYKNELCFDGDTVAMSELHKLTPDYPLTIDEQKILDEYNKLLQIITTVDEYNPAYSYGPFQIVEELNLYTDKYENNLGKKSAIRKVARNKELATRIDILKELLNQYYQEVVRPKLFHYKLLK